MINNTFPLSIRSQCNLLQVPRSSTYYYSKTTNLDNNLKNVILETYLKTPVYGYRRISIHLRRLGYTVNRKKAQRLMREMGIQGIYPKPRTTMRNTKHNTYPYLLSGLSIIIPHKVWQVDITYLKLQRGFMYLTALIDVYSRYIVGWSLSNTLASVIKVNKKVN